MRLLSTIKYSFTNAPTLTNCPYLFGGVQLSSNRLSSLGNQIIKTLFGNNLKQGLEMAYKGTLQAIADKDVQFLKQNFQNNLTRNISIPDCRVINENSPVSIVETDYKIIVGGTFSRANRVRKLDIAKASPIPLADTLLKMINLQAYLPVDNFYNTYMIIQLGVDITSSFKLVKNQNNNNRNPETHHFQFQSITQINPQDVSTDRSNIMASVKFLQQRMLTPNSELKNYVWKISDIDYTLKGNPWQIINN